MTNSEARKRQEEANAEVVTLTTTEALEMVIEMLSTVTAIIARINKEIFGISDERPQS